MDTEIAVVEQPQGLMIFGTASPTGIITKATAIADALAPLIEKKKLYKVIGPKKHVYVEGWNTMLAMLGVFPSVEYSRKIGDAPIAYESRVVLKHVSGVVVGAGEALCTADEKNWNAKDEFQLKSMSQTRATGKAARLSFSWIMGLAGYEGTPAEEVYEDDGVPAREPIKEPARKSDSGEVIKIVPLDVRSKTGETNGKPWTKWAVKLDDGRFASTLDENAGAILTEAKDKKQSVELSLVKKGDFTNIVRAVLA